MVTGLSDKKEESTPDPWFVYGLRIRGSDECRYVGITTNTLDRRMYGHKHSSLIAYRKTPVNDWLRKHFEDVEIYELEKVEAGDRDLLSSREVYWISCMKERDNSLLNIDSGGFGVHDRRGPLHPLWGVGHSPETKKKMSENRKKWTYSDEYRQRRSVESLGKNNHFYGKKHSEETREKMKVSSHIRWHVRLDKPSESCKLCISKEEDHG